VKDKLTEIDAIVADLIELLNTRKEPGIEIGGHCTNPLSVTIFRIAGRQPTKYLRSSGGFEEVL
jgi:hypothetical protein